MNELRKGHSSLVAAWLAAAAATAAYERSAEQIVRLEPRTPERLNKAEKKRARKAAQRAKLAQRGNGVST